MINFTSELYYSYVNDNYFYLRNSYFHEVYAINNENHLIIDEYKKNALIIVSNTPP